MIMLRSKSLDDLAAKAEEDKRHVGSNGHQ